ncbi:polysaccharide biosynthesis tyrosine autokinase [Mucilaginibacter sp. 21P]|uniref:polysaccharide biosynthesis tyrosine autokinase n=1 Tax=Mucilaginibacter sp. 21P TaxID=2778902 RepID=UPI001C56791C|nr:polysaccharide biosynthesis tyrosine autokinase [Mucilaginibacter sp. 21P]QXV63938.1 polysaccharide biosynthesis tyrosine autokinase [Mucilaginibacter sp. 21P]
MENHSTEIKRSISQTIDFYKIYRVFLSRWYWILFCVMFAVGIAKLRLLYTKPIYMSSGSLKLQDAAQGVNTSAASPSQTFSYTDKIQAESYTIRSNQVILDAISKLNYKISYYIVGRINLTELYPNIPFKIEIIRQDSSNFSREQYQVEDVDGSSFTLSNPNNLKKDGKKYRYGEVLSMGNMEFKIVTPIPDRGTYRFNFNAKEDFVGRILGGLNVSEAAKFTNVMSLSQTDGNATFAADLLNEIMKSYIKYDLIQRRMSANQTAEFIDNQMAFIDQATSKSGNSLASYKSSNNITDINSASADVVAKLSDYEKQKAVLKLQLLGIERLAQQLVSNYNKADINLDLEGDFDPMLTGLITQLNKLFANREDMSAQYNGNSAPMKSLDNQITKIKDAIKNNVFSLKNRKVAELEYIDKQIATINESIKRIPKKEQQFVKLNANFEVNNKVRSFLSEKKLEAEMNAAAVVPSASIVNPAYVNNFSIAADSGRTYTYAILLGLGAGIGLILLVRFLNPYIYDKETVEALTQTPIIGVIREFPSYIDKSNTQALSLAKPKSVFAESVRSVRTNLSFMASHKQSKIICITSEISGEGKSFVTINLASTLALIDKKILLIAGDLRRSRLHHAFGIENKKGLSTYLSDQNTLEEITVHDKTHKIDFIPSGPVPPNPSELLHTKKMKDLLVQLTASYDYILVDTAPVGLVSDAIPLIRESDINLFIIRSGTSQLRAANIPERLSREYGLSNMAIILNAFGNDALHSNYYTTDYSKGSGNETYYYSDYSGYASSGYYDEDPKKWWQFWKSGKND